MFILSFDVGIKNLAYCILNKDTYKIQEWDIINISCDDMCQHVSSNGKQCDNLNKYVINDICLCTQHTNLKQYKGSKKKNIISKNTLYNIGNKIVNIFDTLFTNYNFDQVIIENQPSLKNPTMKSIQMIIYTYFLIKFNCNVELINAGSKLKVCKLKLYKGPKVIIPFEDNKKNRYKINKYLAIQYCKNMIESEDDKYKTMFNNSKKKDDLADSYLQCIYYLNK